MATIPDMKLAQLGWFVGLWAASVLTLAIVAYLLRWWIHA
jgi:hypothetical protein